MNKQKNINEYKTSKKILTAEETSARLQYYIKKNEEGLVEVKNLIKDIEEQYPELIHARLNMLKQRGQIDNNGWIHYSYYDFPWQ